jgi:hypothetical protein
MELHDKKDDDDDDDNNNNNNISYGRPNDSKRSEG